MQDEEPQQWYSRGYIPHFDNENRPQMVTYRLADSLPQHVLEQELERRDLSFERRVKFEKLLDAGHGSCVLRDPKCAQIVIDNWKYHDGDKYRLLDWVIMPNHVHVGYDRPRVPMSEITHSWKSYTANRIKAVLGTVGDGKRLWCIESVDRYARDEVHLFNMQSYMFLNPVKAGLVDDPFDWPWSSVHEHEYLRESIERWWARSKERFFEIWRR
jgi:REP element-mobilizing transposase RayT